MPCVGNLCPQDGQERQYAHCLHECQQRCMPLPLLLVLMRQRPIVPETYSATEILNPPKIVWLNRNTEYYINPMTQIAAALGTAFHTVLEEGVMEALGQGLGDQFVVEQPFSLVISTPFGHATLTGRPDLYDKAERTLWDYKTAKAYPTKIIKGGDWSDSKFLHQVNIYRVFGFPEAQHQKLCIAVKDYGPVSHIKDGLDPVEIIDVPIMTPELVREVVASKIGILLQNEADPSTIRDCLPEELWGGKRCEEYCAVREFCLQGLANNGTRRGAHGRNKKR